MAITWDVKITIIDIEQRRASILASRTDDTDPANIKLWSIVLNTIIDTQEQKLAVLNFIWDQYQDSLTKQTAIDTIIGDLETQAKNNLESREI